MGLPGRRLYVDTPHHTHTHTHTHMHTLTPDLCIYALRRHSSKGYGWRGRGENRKGEMLFGLQTETDRVLGGVKGGL